MKWIVKLVAESTPGHTVEQEIVTFEREDLLSPASIGLSIAEGKLILERLQTQVVAVQVHHHNVSLKSCFRCGRSFRSKGYYQSTLRSIYGNVPMRVRRIRGCSCTGTQHRSYSTLPVDAMWEPLSPKPKRSGVVVYRQRASVACILAVLEIQRFEKLASTIVPLGGKTCGSQIAHVNTPSEQHAPAAQQRKMWFMERSRLCPFIRLKLDNRDLAGIGSADQIDPAVDGYPVRQSK